jgi:hypothetical protein
MNSVEKDKLKESFKEAANSLAFFHKESIQRINNAYYLGQKDALNEIVQFALKESKGDLRNLSTKTLLQFIENKVYELEEKQIELENKMNNKSTNSNAIQPESNQISDLPTPLREAFKEDSTPLVHPSGMDLMSATGLEPQNYKPNYFFQQGQNSSNMGNMNSAINPNNNFFFK